MKCKKCGNELKLADKFCPECGEKIEPKNISECPICHEPINNGCIICPHCKNNIHTYNVTPPSPNDSESNKKNIKYTIITIACCIAAILGIVLAANSCTDSTIKETDFEPTTATLSSDIYNDSFREYDFDNIIYSVPNSWEYNSDDDIDHFYVDDDSNNMLIISKSSLDDNVDEEMLDVFVDAFDTQFDNYSGILDEKVVICNSVGRNRRFTFSVDDVDYYGNFYFFSYKNKIFIFEFISEGYFQCAEFNAYQDEIVDSIAISKYITSTEETTKKPTEPPTEKPTEITDRMVKLFEDNELTVYYSDVEEKLYSDDEVLVHLFIENKTNEALKFYADTVILDGISYNDVICADLVSANSKGMIEIDVDDCNNTDPKTVGADLQYQVGDDYFNDVTLNIVSHDVK